MLNSPRQVMSWESLHAAEAEIQQKPKTKTAPLSSLSPAKPAVAPAAASAPLAAAPAVKSTPVFGAFEPYYASVKNGVAQIVGRAGETLLLLEVKLSELSESAKVWVLGIAESLKKRGEPYAKAIRGKADALYTEVRGKAVRTIQPIYAKVVDGAVFLQGKMEGYTIAIRLRMSDTYGSVVAKVSESYAIWVEPTYNLTKRSIANKMELARKQSGIAQQKLLAAAEPYWLKAKDGSQYLRMKVGSTVVYIKTSASEKTARLSELTMSAYSKAFAKVNSYTAPIIEKVVAMYTKLGDKLYMALEPIMTRLKQGTINFKLAINSIVTRVQVKALTAKKATTEFGTECYIKVKNGFLFVQGRIGETVLSIKVRLSDVAKAVNMKMLKLKSDAEAQLLQMTKYAKAKTATIRKEIGSAAGDKQLQVTAGSAVAGAAALGASGGATGLVAGGAVGAAVGVVPALFTFGLSIPIGAVLGGATGLCVGTVAGGTVGAVGGGAAGRSSYKHKDEIVSGVNGIATKASGYKQKVAEKACDYKVYVAEQAATVKARVVGGTGGTA